MKTIVHHSTRRIGKLAIMAIGIISFVFSESETQAQQYNQFATGVNLNVIRQPGTAHFNPAQYQYLQAMRQRQHALSNIGTAFNLQAARLNAQRKQIHSVRRAQIAQMQAMAHMRNAMILQAQQRQAAYWNFVRGRR